MATAAIGIAPVLTPQTLGMLADTLERTDLPDKAVSLRRLQPLVEGVVQTYFVPLAAPPRKGRFANRFSRLAREFEFARLYLNVVLFSALGSYELLNFYQQALYNLLGPLLKRAREMEMEPELISAVFSDYMKIVEAVMKAVAAPTEQSANMTIGQFTALADWVHSATRLDYALTAIFLVLEEAIPTPTPSDKGALLSSCKDTLLEFGRATSKVFVHEDIQRVMRQLETRSLEVLTVRIGVQGLSSVRSVHAAKGPVLGVSSRQSEVNWLKRNKQVSEHYGGQWIVLEKDEMVAHDEDYKKAREAATRRGIKRPFIIFIPRKESGGFMGI
jgi:hypothetical protein